MSLYRTLLDRQVYKIKWRAIGVAFSMIVEPDVIYQEDFPFRHSNQDTFYAISGHSLDS